MSSLKEFVTDKLKILKANNNYRSLKTVTHLKDGYVIYNGKKLLSFASNDYLGLRFNSEIMSNALELSKSYGTSGSSSRLISGNYDLYNILEEKIAAYYGFETACVFGSGYLANIGTIPALAGKDDLIIADKLIHACLIDAIKLSGAKLIRYNHNDLDHCAKLLDKYRKYYKNCLIISESVFSMDGTSTDIEKLILMASNYDSWLYIDDAHGTGIRPIKPDILMGNFSKSYASYGGFVCGSNDVIDYIKNSARSLIFTSSLPPIVIATSIASFNFIEQNLKICEIPREKAELFCEILDLPKSNSHIVSIILGGSLNALNAASELEQYGYLISSIRPPTVPKNTARLRFSFAANHRDEDIIKLANIIKDKKYNE